MESERARGERGIEDAGKSFADQCLNSQMGPCDGSGNPKLSEDVGSIHGAPVR
jgi:hypothetical protein